MSEKSVSWDSVHTGVEDAYVNVDTQGGEALIINFEGFRPDWYIFTIICSRDKPFKWETLGRLLSPCGQRPFPVSWTDNSKQKEPLQKWRQTWDGEPANDIAARLMLITNQVEPFTSEENREITSQSATSANRAEVKNNLCWWANQRHRIWSGARAEVKENWRWRANHHRRTWEMNWQWHTSGARAEVTKNLITCQSVTAPPVGCEQRQAPVVTHGVNCDSFNCLVDCLA